MTNDKKVALITGANRGIGLETARQLGQKGITVVVAARSLAAAQQTAATLQAEGIDAFPVKLDVTDAAVGELIRAPIFERRQLLDGSWHPSADSRHRRLIAGTARDDHGPAADLAAGRRHLVPVVSAPH